jgi:hypothetical protein
MASSQNVRKAKDTKSSTVGSQSSKDSTSNIDPRILVVYERALNKRNEEREESHLVIRNEIAKLEEK